MKGFLPYRNNFFYSFLFNLLLAVIALPVLSCGLSSRDSNSTIVTSATNIPFTPVVKSDSYSKDMSSGIRKDENNASRTVSEKEVRISSKVEKEVTTNRIKSDDTAQIENKEEQNHGQNRNEGYTKLPIIPTKIPSSEVVTGTQPNFTQSVASSNGSLQITARTPIHDSTKFGNAGLSDSSDHPDVDPIGHFSSSETPNDQNDGNNPGDTKVEKSGHPKTKISSVPTPSVPTPHRLNLTKTPIMFKGYPGSPTPVVSEIKILPTQQPTPTLSVSTKTPVPTITPTVIPSPTHTPIPTPTPTPTPTPIPWNDVYGVAVHTSSGTSDDAKYFLDKLGLKWHVDFSSSKDLEPDGTEKLRFLGVPKDQGLWDSGNIKEIESMSDNELKNLGIFTRTELREKSANDKGAYWYLFGEPNRYGYIDGDSFATLFHYYTEQLKLGDATAKIIGTSVLNWDFTCIGCGGEYDCEDEKLKGFQCGKVWFKNLITAYEQKYGHKPVVDAWGFNAYPLDWITVPNSKLHVQIAVDQISGIRGYLDTIPEYTNIPIWVTEIALHVGYDNYTYNYQTGFFEPTGDYRWDKMSEFLVGSLDWLEENYAPGKLEKWFFFNTWTPKINPSAYMGIIFFDGGEPGSSLNCLGQVYKYRALGQKNFKCGSNGQLVESQ